MNTPADKPLQKAHRQNKLADSYQDRNDPLISNRPLFKNRTKHAAFEQELSLIVATPLQIVTTPLKLQLWQNWAELLSEFEKIH